VSVGSRCQAIALERALAFGPVRRLLATASDVALLACAETPVAPPASPPKAARTTPLGCVAPSRSLVVESLPAEYSVHAPIIGIEDWRPKADAGCPTYDEDKADH
jgi:hypothetical protein